MSFTRVYWCWGKDDEELKDVMKSVEILYGGQDVVVRKSIGLINTLQMQGHVAQGDSSNTITEQEFEDLEPPEGKTKLGLLILSQ